MKYFILFSVLLFTHSAVSQDCIHKNLAQIPGTWKAGMKGSIVGVTATDLAREKAVMADIHKMVSSNYSPMGCQISYGPVYGKNPMEGEIFIADPYYYSMFILRYLCDQYGPDKSKYYIDISTPTTVNIVANAINSLSILRAANLETNHFRGYLKLEERPIKKDGYYFSKEKVSYNEEIWEYRWLITYDDTLPFTYLTRKEYLLIQKKRLEKSVLENPSGEKYSKKYFDRINEFLSRSEDELSKEAICMWNDEERFEGFVEEGTRGSFIAVKPDLGYYKMNLPKSSPQFFTVIYKLGQGDPVFEANISAIKEAVDFAALRSMLGK